MTEIIKQIFEQNVISSIKFSVVIILLLALTKPVVKRYTAGFRYYSWLAVMLIFLIPFGKLGISYKIPISPVIMDIQSETRDIRNWYEQKLPQQTVTKTVPVKQNNGGQAENPPSEETTATVKYKTPIDVKLILSVIWLIGAVLFLILHIKRYFSFKRAVKRISSPLCDESTADILESEKQKLKITSDIPVRVSSAADTPMLVGIIHPFIILSENEFSDDELHFIFRHELIHYKRKDILYQLITLIFISLNWYNPFAYIMARAIEIDGETACDEKVIKGKAYETRVFYGEMLIKFLKTQNQKKSYMTTTFFGGKKGMKKRLTLIASKKIRKKGTAAMVVLMAFTIAASVCAAAMSNEFFDEVFSGDTSYLADFVKTERQSVSDENYTLTLEQYLVAEKQAVVIFSIEAQTDAAIAEFNAVDERGNSTFWDMDTIGFGPVDYDKAYRSGFSTGSLNKKFDTERKRYFVLECNSIDNKDKIDFYICTNKIKGSPKIFIPMESNIETKTLKFDNIGVQYNPISIELSYPVTEKNVCDWCGIRTNYFYFRMKNGEIKTFNQLYRQDGSNIEANAGHFRAWAKRIIKPDEIKSIIVNDTEYPADGVSNSKKIEIDNRLKPFTIKPYIKEHLWLPLREFCEKLGADIVWNESDRTATVTYRGSTYVFTPGSTKIIIDGETVDYYNKEYDQTTFIDERGRMIVTPSFTERMNIDCHGYNMYNEEGGINPNAMMHIVP